jgi:hypothetical protein
VILQESYDSKKVEKPMSVYEKANYYVTKGALELLDSVSIVLAKVSGLSEKERNSTIIDCSIPYLRYESEDGNASRPIAFLKKYIEGTGKDEEVDLFTLLIEDKGVRGSVHRQITSVLAQQQLFNDTGIDISKSGRLSNARAMEVSGTANSYKQKLTRFQTKELLFDVPQRDFQVNDWKNAIGGIQVNWSLIDVRNDKKAVFARLWGTNIYRWHPELTRKSQVVHKAAERMKEFGAKDFRMVFRPCLISVATGDLERL